MNKGLSRRERVLLALAEAVMHGVVYRRYPDGKKFGSPIACKGGRVPGWLIADQFIGGSEGLRRLRDLREDGFKINNFPVKGSTDDYYLEIGYSEAFDVLYNGRRTPKEARHGKNIHKGDDCPHDETSVNLTLF